MIVKRWFVQLASPLNSDFINCRVASTALMKYNAYGCFQVGEHVEIENKILLTRPLLNGHSLMAKPSDRIFSTGKISNDAAN